VRGSTGIDANGMRRREFITARNPGSMKALAAAV
jgi:hypothetical protein